MNQDSSFDSLFFQQTVSSYTTENKRFIHRQWLASAVEDCLREKNLPFILLTAEPGAGKTSFMAQLARDHPDWLRYFIRRNQRLPLGSVDAKSFLLRIGFQLAARKPDLFDNASEQLRIIVEQQVGSIEEGGEAIGAKINRLLASPFSPRLLRVQQNVRQNKGQLVGISVQELVMEPGLMDTADIVSMALLAPAATLKKLQPEARIVILVDALDEILYHDPEEETILDWLVNAPELPDNIRFVLSSRPPESKLKFLIAKQGDRLSSLAIDPDDKHVKQDVQVYAQSLLNSERGLAIQQQFPERTKIFVEQAALKANGNLGYLDALGRGIEKLVAQDTAESLEDLNDLLDLKELPDEMGSLYAFFLHQIKHRLELMHEGVPISQDNGFPLILPAWEAVYLPVLGLLAIAYQPLSVERIRVLGPSHASTAYVQRVLDGLSQFLEASNEQYRLYHATMAEFLLAATSYDLQNQDLFIDARDAHARVVAYYHSPAKSWANIDWQNVDTYGLTYLSSHLATLSNDKKYRQELYDLLCSPLLREKQRRSGSHLAFSRDVAHAFAAARDASPPEIVPMARAGILHTRLNDIGLSLYSEYYGLMTGLGMVEMALGYAETITHLEPKLSAYLEIAKKLPVQDQRKISLVQDIVRFLLPQVPVELSIEDQEHVDLIKMTQEELVQAINILMHARAFSEAIDMLNLIKREDYLLAVLDTISPHVAVSRPEEFHEDFARQGWNCIERIPNQREAAILAWAPVLARAGGRSLVMPAILSGTVQPEKLDLIAKGLIFRGEPQSGLDLLRHVQTPEKRVAFLSGLVSTLVAAGADQQARLATNASLRIMQDMPAGLDKTKAFYATLLCLDKIGEISNATDMAKQSLEFVLGVEGIRQADYLSLLVNSTPDAQARTSRALISQLQNYKLIDCLLPIIESGSYELVEAVSRNLLPILKLYQKLYKTKSLPVWLTGLKSALWRRGYAELDQELCQEAHALIEAAISSFENEKDSLYLPGAIRFIA